MTDAYPFFHRVVGVDLGTSSCAVSVWDGAKLLMVRGPTGAATMPATVGQDRAGQVIAGVPPADDPENVIAGVKRLLGSGEPVRFRGRTYQPREICAFLLIELKRQAETFVGEPIHDVVITVSAAAGEAQRRALREAAGLAQLNVRRLVEDPAAAAMALGADARPGTYAIYDLGGGTCDASVVRVADGTIEVLGTSGDQRLGGDDFDELIVAFALRQIRERYHVDLSRDPTIRRRIRWEAEIRKRELSVADHTTLELPVLTATVSASVPLSRRAFEAMIEPDVQRSLDLLTEAIAAARAAHGVGWGDIDEVVLAGGSTRIPAVRDRLAGYFGWGAARLRTDLDPAELAARGAGLVARDYEPASLFEGSPVGLLSASLRLRAELAAPAVVAADEPAETPDPPGPSGPPAETPADFRRVAEAAYMLLLQDGEHDGLGSAYGAFIAAVQAAAPDARLTELGETLSAEYNRAAS
ncbi:Hsp70 family protein [Actinoplanes bogorensis]|uniref:Hsp70 family protein n=1 Tax=Paractinoplanes bogorensis TaxID=1610840 RepID=A0ABS5YGN5_9ACTN|nr:Hsp70 family protein [Actinoplanes bogorensis]MBU2662615.1 Hsp70 family protein [Actinoplanes bogorensis]